VIFFAVVISLSILTGCGKKRESTKPKIGVILPQTGLLGEIGQYEKNAFDLAFDHLQQLNRKSFDAVFEDGRSDKKAVAAAANKLTDIDHVELLVTSTTGASLAAQPVAQRAHLPQLAFCMGSEVARNSPATVRFYIGVEEEAQAIIDFVRKNYAKNRVGILHASEAQWTTALKNIYHPTLDAFLSSPLVVEQYDVKDKDFRAQINRLQQANVDVVIILGYGFEFGPLFTQLHETGFAKKSAIIGGWGFLYTPVPADQLEGVYVAGPMYIYEKNSLGVSFDNAFFAKYGHHANFDAAFAYELAIRIPDVLDLISIKGQTALKAELAKQGEREGVFGKYRFAPDGNMIVETAVGRYRSGTIVKD
jgi:branched-chain amino acid transport system substrate-binding protein